jgi:hypothetical protein
MADKGEEYAQRRKRAKEKADARLEAYLEERGDVPGFRGVLESMLAEQRRTNELLEQLIRDRHDRTDSSL